MTTALLLIDIQRGFEAPIWGERNNPDAEDKAGALLAHWRQQRAPVVHIRHVSKEPGSPLGPQAGGTTFKPQVHPIEGETVFEKSVNSAFIGTNLEDHLREPNINALVICGLTTPHCVSTTTRMAANLGFRIQLAHDACAAFITNANTAWDSSLPPMTAQQIHEASVSHLHDEFAQAVSVADLLRCKP